MFGIVRARSRATTAPHPLNEPSASRRAFSAVLAVLLAASLVPSPAWAAAGDEGAQAVAAAGADIGAPGASAAPDAPLAGAGADGSSADGADGELAQPGGTESPAPSSSPEDPPDAAQQESAPTPPASPAEPSPQDQADGCAAPLASSVAATGSRAAAGSAAPYGAGATAYETPLGVYELSSVKLESSGQGMQAGNTITPKAQVKNGYYESDVPSDAKVTYTWQVRDGEPDVFRPLTEGVAANGALTLAEALVGKQVRVSANALVPGNNPQSGVYTVLASNTFDLLRATLSPSTGELFTGDELVAAVLAKSLASSTYGDTVTDEVDIAWSMGATKDGEFAPIAGAQGKTLTIPAEAAGCYLKATATSGGSTVEAVTARAIVASDSLEGAAKKLDQANFKPNPAYGTHTNINDLVEAALAKAGYEGVAVTTKAATPKSTNEHVAVGVSTADDATNGDVTYCYADPDDLAGSSVSYSTLCQFEFTFVLARGGETYEYAPYYTGIVPWDDARMEEMLAAKADALAIQFASGDAAASVTQDFALPTKLFGADGTGKSWSEVTWASGDTTAVRITGYAWDDAYTGKVVRTSKNRPVTLTATVGISTYGAPDITAEKTFEVTIKSDPEQVAAAKTDLEQKVQAGFTYENVKDAASGQTANARAVTGDLRLPTPATLGVDGKFYQVEYTVSNDALAINGWAANVYRPLPGAPPSMVDVTATVTNKENSEITASQTLSFTVEPLDRAAIDAELELMAAAKAGYASTLANGQDAGAVTSDLRTFQKAYRAAGGQLAWAYSKAEADAAGEGIVPVDLEGYDPMGSEGWRLFKSSAPGVVAHENLLVTQPDYHTRVTVSSSLSSQTYARYASIYADDPTYGPLFARLANQNVTATFTVVGSSGQEDPHVTATCSIIGVDAQGAAETWAAARPYTLDASATAADLTEALLEAAGMTASIDTSYGWYLETITSPFDAGRTLGWDDATGRYWQLFVNGAPSNDGAADVVLQPGDQVVWSYSAYGDPAPSDRLSVTCEVIGANAQGATQTWATPTTFAVEEGATAADLTELLFAQKGLVADTGTGDYGWFLNTITSPYDGRVLGWDEATGKYWQLFVNGEYAQVGAGGCVLKAGDTVTWCYGADGTLPGQVAVTAGIIGENANGTPQTWAAGRTYKMVEGATAADLFEQMIVASGLEADYDPDGKYGLSVNTLTSPFDGRVLGYDAATGKYWQFFVNGEASDLGPSSVVLQPGDTVSWCYSAYGQGLPDPDGVVIDPDAPRPSFDASWPGFANGMGGSAVTGRLTPTESAELAWAYDYRGGLADMAAASEPVVVNGRVFLVVTNELRMVNAQTGKLEAAAPLGSTISYQCRPVYADGLIIVPADDGTLTAFTADTLTCVWKTAPLPTEGHTLTYQSLSSLTVNGGCVYAGFTMVGAGGVGKVGTLLCVRLADGSLAWSRTNEAQRNGAFGYYWAGAAASGDDVVVGDESGAVSLVDGQTGDVLSSVQLGSACRAGVVVDPTLAGAAFLAVSADGVLHRVVRMGDTLALAKSVPFAGKSTSTPAAAGGKAFVCAVDEEGYGTLTVIDLSSFKVERTVRGGKGEAQCAPLASVQQDGTVFVYFTCNGLPGGVYGYRLGDSAAYALYTPEVARQQYCMSSVVADEAGNLYYTNDSGTLFALAGKAGAKVTFEANGGTYVPPAYVALGGAVAKPADPVRAGYAFGGWYADAACTQAWDFALPVNAALTLYAKWTANGSGGDGQQGGSDDEVAGVGGSAGGGSPAPAGTVAPGRTPLSAAAVQAAQPEAAPAEAAAGGAANAQARAGSAAAGGTDIGGEGGASGQAPVNPWAVGGIAAGAVGLGAAAAVLLRPRRMSMSKKGA